LNDRRDFTIGGGGRLSPHVTVAAAKGMEQENRTTKVMDICFIISSPQSCY